MNKQATITQATAAKAATVNAGGLSKARLGAYAIAAFSSTMIYQPMNLYVPQLYAKELGFSLAALGTVLVLTQIIDAFSQQLCGFLSDRTRTRWGSRKPWVAFGATMMIVASYFLFRPPPGIGILYFVVWRMVWDFAYTSCYVSYSAWGAELSSDYHQRSRIMGTTGFLGQMGNFANETLPIVLFFLGLTASSAYSMKVMTYYWLAAVVFIPLMYGTALVFAPQGSAPPPERPNFRGMIHNVRINKPFWRYLISFTLSGLGIGALQLNFTFYDGYLHVGKWFPYLMTVFSATMVVSIPFWVWVANRITKHKTYTISMIIGGCAPLGWVLFDPDTASQSLILAYGFVVVFLIGLGVGCNFITTSSILADVADYGALKTGIKRTASYFAFYLLTYKVAMSIGAGLAFMALAKFGYNAKAGAVNTHFAKMGLLLIVAVVPAMLKVPAGLIMWWYPLHPKRHAIVQKALKRRSDRVAQALALSTDVQGGVLIDPSTLAAEPVGAIPLHS
jgi:Na+/melibiose symporter-like transporter